MRPKKYFKKKSRYKKKKGMTIAGIYFLLKNREIVYIGQSKWIIFRILSGHSYGKDKKDWDEFRMIECSDINKRREYETRWLNRFRPKYNRQIPKIKSEHKNRFLRLPLRIFNKVKRRAKQNNRLINSQIIFELEQKPA
jgi:hypothetical protein